MYRPRNPPAFILLPQNPLRVSQQLHRGSKYLTDGSKLDPDVHGLFSADNLYPS